MPMGHVPRVSSFGSNSDIEELSPSGEVVFRSAATGRSVAIAQSPAQHPSTSDLGRALRSISAASSE
jgi:hypothetical protein